MIALLPQTGFGTGEPLLPELLDSLSFGTSDRFDAAFAYAVRSGFDAIEPHLVNYESRWIIGLDDYVTDPNVLHRIFSSKKSKLRVASLNSKNRRFHPKVFCIWSSKESNHADLFVGSNNLSDGGLEKNVEFAVKIRAAAVSDAEAFKSSWLNIWDTGIDVTPSIISDYDAKFKSARAKLATVKSATPPPMYVAPLTAAAALPAIWLEIGSATAQGREVELPSALSWFLSSPGGTLSFVDTSGNTLNVSYKYRADNHMWRLGFKSSDISRLVGRATFQPSPGVRRSDLVLRLQRTSSGAIEVSIYPISSAVHAAFRNASISSGSLVLTRPRSSGGREFGT